jgi:cell division protein FtsA
MALIEHDDLIEVGGVQGAPQVVKISQLARIVEPRAREILMLVGDEIASKRLQPFMTSGLVLTGGGALLRGIDLVARQILGVPIRIGRPTGAHALPAQLENPIYATAYGLLLFAARQREGGPLALLEGPLTKRLFVRMKSWVLDFF